MLKFFHFRSVVRCWWGVLVGGGGGVGRWGGGRYVAGGRYVRQVRRGEGVSTLQLGGGVGS